MIKLCPHFQTLPAWTRDRKRKPAVQFPGQWIKIMDPGPGISAHFPGKRICGRFYVQDEGQYIRQGAAGADAYFTALATHYAECRPELSAIEGPNEPGCSEVDQVRTLAEFLLRWIELMHGEGLPAAVPAFSTGCPEPWVMDVLAPVMQATDFWTLHEYGLTAIQEPDAWARALRHRMLIRHMRERCIRVPPLLITECGLDRGGDGYKHKPGNTPWPAYLRQLLAYDTELQQDPAVIAAFVFTSGADPAWTSFDVGEAEWRDLAKALASSAALTQQEATR